MPTKVACHSCARFRRTSFLTTEARDRIRGSISLSSFAPYVSDCVMSRQRRRHSMVRGYEIGERPAVAMPSRTTHAGAHPFRARSLSVSRGRPHALSVPRTGAAHSIERREPGARPFGPHVQFECVTAFSSDCSAARGRKPSWLMAAMRVWGEPGEGKGRRRGAKTDGKYSKTSNLTTGTVHSFGEQVVDPLRTVALLQSGR